MITINSLEKVENGHTVIPSFNLTIKSGTQVAIHCNQKQGKFLIDLFASRTTATSGSINITEDSVGIFQLDDTMYSRLSVKDNLRFFNDLHQKSGNVHQMLQEWGLLNYGDLRFDRLDSSVQRRALIARAIIQKPSVIILEDPEHAVNHETRKIFRWHLHEWQKRGHTILLTYSYTDETLDIHGDLYRMTENEFQAITSDKNDNHSLSIKKIPAKSEEKTILFDPDEIDYIESSNGNTLLHTNKGQYLSSVSLHELEQQLESFGFFRTHRSYLVNLQRVREVMKWTRNSYSLVLSSVDTQIPLAKAKLTALYEKLGIEG